MIGISENAARVLARIKTDPTLSTEWFGARQAKAFKREMQELVDARYVWASRPPHSGPTSYKLRNR